MKKKIYWALVALYALTIGYELSLNTIVDIDSRSSVGAITQVPLALIPIIGSSIGLGVARSWGGFKSRLGKAIIFYSLGLLAWGLGVVGWLIYIYILGITEVPYPSPADFVYMFAQIMWYTASIIMARVIGAQYGLKQKGWIKAIIATIFAVALSYVLLVTVARDGSLEASGFTLGTFFDFYYPIATALSLALTIVVYILARKYLGGLYKKALLVLFAGFIFQFLGDFTYTLTTFNETYYNGHWADVLFTTAMLVLTTGLMMYDPNRVMKLKDEGTSK